jgi:hypothetical protein
MDSFRFEYQLDMQDNTVEGVFKCEFSTFQRNRTFNERLDEQLSERIRVMVLHGKNEDRCAALFGLFSADQATIFLTAANGLSPNHDCMDLMMLCGPENFILERSLSIVVTPIQIEVIVRRSVVT